MRNQVKRILIHTRSMILKEPTYLVGTRLKIQVNTANVEKIVVNYLVQALWKEQKVIISCIEWMKNSRCWY